MILSFDQKKRPITDLEFDRHGLRRDDRDLQDPGGHRHRARELTAPPPQLHLAVRLHRETELFVQNVGPALQLERVRGVKLHLNVV